MKIEKGKGKLKDWIRDTASKLWNKTDGWKTVAGVVLHLGWGVIHMTNNIDSTVIWSVHGGIGNITGVGTGHKIHKFVKSNLGKKVIGIVGKALKIK